MTLPPLVMVEFKGASSWSCAPVIFYIATDDE